MALFSKFGENVRNRAESKVAAWVTPKGAHALRVSNLEAGYTLGVFLIGLVLLGFISGKGYGALLVIFGIVAAISRVVKTSTIPVLYANLAPRLGWPSWADGWAQDAAEAAGRPQGAATQAAPLQAPLAPAAAPVPTPTPKVESPRTKILGAWAGLPVDRQKARAVDVANHLRTLPGDNQSLEILDNVPDGEGKEKTAFTLLSLVAQAEGVTAVASQS